MKKNFVAVLRYVALTILGGCFLFPVYWMTTAALKPGYEVFKMPPTWIPSRFVWSNFPHLFKIAPLYPRWAANTFIVSAVVTIVALYVHAMAAYSLARLRYPGRRLIFYIIISTLMIPITSVLIPRFVIVRAFGWVDTYWGLIIPAIPHAFGIFFLHQFYIQFPRELEEAAIIDGCSPAGVFFKVVLPLSRSVFAALAVFFFLANWNSYLWPLLIVQRPELKTLQLGLAGFVGPYDNPWGSLMAANTIAVLPALLLFFILQRQLMSSITMTGLKG
ncbi:MAG: carbohydrate ABC transporter permease [Candidatus Hadarchaeum sp.]|uniref:carbohydrate ABC transporter permease n=1 Tax=Candidatus Hadarchaeum sp. TaxID=2883567 RepID=UPI00316D6784